MFKRAKLLCEQLTELKGHGKYPKITLEDLMGQIRQNVRNICLKLFVHNENIYENVFQLVKSIFLLDCNPRYAYSTPLFPSWTPPSKEDEAAHKVTIIQESDSEEKVSDEVARSSLGLLPLDLIMELYYQTVERTSNLLRPPKEIVHIETVTETVKTA